MIGPPPFDVAVSSLFGPLPTGTHTYEIYEVYEGGPPQFVSTQPLVVSASIPALPPSALIALAFVLAGVAIFGLRHVANT